jgi:ribose 5-phosphate isomerase B
MRVHLGGDHAGYEAKNAIAEHLRQAGHEVVDHGPFTDDPQDDYPVFCLRTALGVAADPSSRGVVVGGSGNGEQMAANKVAGVRAVLAYDETTARLGREHNDANVLGVGARRHPLDEVLRLVDTFLATPFSGDARHARRIAMLTAYEETGELPPMTR